MYFQNIILKDEQLKPYVGILIINITPLIFTNDNNLCEMINLLHVLLQAQIISLVLYTRLFLSVCYFQLIYDIYLVVRKQ